jgi:hypothetical protein
MRLLVAFCATLLIAADHGVPPPDKTKGVIDGKTATYFMPLAGVEDVPGSGAKFERILPGDGCEVFLASTQDLERELVYPCSTWILPPEGNFRIWLEGVASVSEGHGVLMWEHEPFKGYGQVAGFGMEPAGRVALAKSVAVPPGASFRLVHLRTETQGLWRSMFDRRAVGNRVRTGVGMPLGSVLTGLFDSKTGDALALAKPVNIEVGKTVFTTPAPPRTGSDVMVVLTRPREAKAEKNDLSLSLSIDGKPRPPDVFVPAKDRIIAVWYVLDARKATLHTTSKSLRLDPVDLTLTPNKVTTHRAKLALLPSVTLNIHTPDAVAKKEMKAELRRAHTSAAIQQLDVKPNHEYRFEHVPAELLEVVLTFGPWRFKKPVDLTAGLDENVIFDLDPVTLTGTVFYGRDAAPSAVIDFHADKGLETVVANEEGRYEAILWRRDGYVAEVKVPSVSLPFAEGPFEVTRSTTLDFHVPNTNFEVDVKDAVTGKPIKGASVFAASVSKHGDGERNVVQTAISDERGRAILPPFREGSLQIRARADGYHDSEPANDRVASVDDRGHHEILLRPVGETLRVKVAAGAEVWAVKSTDGYQQPLWQGQAGAHGYADVPRDLDTAYFLIRAEGAAPAVRRMSDEWTLTKATAPLTLKLDRQSRLALWIDGVRVSGAALIFLTRSLDATQTNGLWTAAALPAQSLRVLAWRKAAIESGAYDAAAETLPYPWPAVVEVRAID